MPAKIEIPLPPLRSRIRKYFFFLIALYALLGFFMMLSVFLASGTTPKVIHVNYDSIAAVRQMQESWNALQNPAFHSNKKQEEWISQFDRALAFEEKNVTEPGEGTVAKEVHTLWNEMREKPNSITFEKYSRMREHLEQLVRVNEQGMFRIAEDATSFGRKVFFGSVGFFLITLFLAVLIADGLATRLARPIKQIAEVLRDDPQLESKLRLPKSDSLEMRILTSEIGSLWQRVSKFQKINIEELAAERERLETVLTSVEDAILVLDNEGRVIQVSEGMLKVLNLKTSDVIDYFWLDLSSSSENYLNLRERLKTDLPNDNAFELTIDGKKRSFAARCRDVTTPKGTKVGQVYLLHDITELRHRERLKNEFIGVLSHELKTPLQSLGTAAELLTNRVSKMDEDTKMLTETINEDVARIRAVANDFMQVSVVDLHSLKLKLEKVPLSEHLKEWIKPFKVLARDKKVELEFVKEGSEVIWAKADIIKLPWAISNLLANAIRVSKPESKVTVYMTDRNSAAQIEIRDEGPGIPPAVQARMFEPYYQAPVSESGASAGFLGLGLTIAKEVVEAHQGKLEYYPRRPQGSIFRISIPYQIVYGGTE